LVYHGATNGRHNTDACGDATLRLARFGRDRFAGLRANSDSGTLMTEAFVYPEDGLTLNAAAEGGEVSAALCDETGAAIAGLRFEDCRRICGDALSHRIGWHGSDVASVARNRQVRLKLRVQNATVYAVGFGLTSGLTA